MNEKKYDKASSIDLLKEKYRDLIGKGENRFPQRSDFTEEEIVAIKAHLGPWPRALEAAGIKEPRNDDRLEKNKEKRRNAKRRRIEELKKQKFSQE